MGGLTVRASGPREAQGRQGSSWNFRSHRPDGIESGAVTPPQLGPMGSSGAVITTGKSALSKAVTWPLPEFDKGLRVRWAPAHLSAPGVSSWRLGCPDLSAQHRGRGAWAPSVVL